MLTLDATTKSLQVTLAEAIATSQLPYVAAYVDLNQTTIALTSSGAADGVTTGTTPVTVVAAPAASTTRKLNYLSVVNLDTIAHTVSVQVLSSASTRVICRVTLATGEQVHFTDARGFYALDAAGQIKQAGGGGGSGTPGGSDTQVQFNDGGAFGGDAGLVYTKASDQLTAGSVTLSLGQLAFPATANPSANAYTIDDYREGTWTVTDASGQGLTINNVGTATYVKVGQLCVIQCDIILPATGNTTVVTLGGIPFGSINNAFYGGCLGLSTKGTAILPVVSALTMQIRDLSANVLTYAQMTDTRIAVNVAYRTAS